MCVCVNNVNVCMCVCLFCVLFLGLVSRYNIHGWGKRSLSLSNQLIALTILTT
jgi:hypothetical protein